MISAATGNITRFYHIIDDSESRDSPDENAARTMAIAFLKNTRGFQENDYTFYSKVAQKYDNRTDYSFTWQKNNVNIPWSDEKDSGRAKLIISATVAGKEILNFSQNVLDTPEKFTRTIQRQIYNSRMLSSIFTIFYIVIIVSAAYFVILRRGHLVMQATKMFAIILTVVIFFLNITSELNEFQYTIFRYDTATSLQSYFLNYFLQLVISLFLISVSFMMPTLAGESLRSEV